MQYIELTLDDDTKVKIGYETADITAASSAATFGTLSNGAQLINLNGKGRFIGFKAKTQHDHNTGVDVIMGFSVLYNGSTQCDVGDTISIASGDPTTMSLT